MGEEDHLENSKAKRKGERNLEKEKCFPEDFGDRGMRNGDYWGHGIHFITRKSAS